MVHFVVPLECHKWDGMRDNTLGLLQLIQLVDVLGVSPSKTRLVCVLCG